MDINQPQTFGALLKRHRLAAGLSQEQLAERAGLTAQAVSALERGFRRTPYHDTVRALVQALALMPADAEALEASVTRSRALAPAVRDRTLRALPLPPSPIVGRQREGAEVEALLHRITSGSSARLLTLLGPGGVGKTRLALHVAHALAEEYADGAAFVPLASVGDSELVATAIAQALAVIETAGRGLVDALIRRLSDMELLLVLDNFEHVAAAAPLVADLLAACRGLRVLATSRARLRLSAEHVYLVPPLPLPDPGYASAPADLARVPAVALLLDRARAVGADIELDATSAPALTALCRHLDGLPLALELAAPRLAVLSPHELLQRLTAPLHLLTDGARDLPERQQTLRATLDWSYALLDPGAKAAFRRLSVVQAGCTLDAAEVLCTAGDTGGAPFPLERQAAANWLAALIDQSLLRRETAAEGGEPRFAMLETVRAYGLERLDETGEGEGIRRTYALHYLALAQEAQRELGGSRQAAWLLRLDRERDNLRAALEWALDRGDADVSQRLAGALWRYWLARGALTEGRTWLHRALHLHADDAAVDATARAEALIGACMLALEQGAAEEAEGLAVEAVSLAGARHQDRPLVAALNARGLVARWRARYSDCAGQHEQALALARTIGDSAGVVASLASLGTVAFLTGDVERGGRLYEESLAGARQLGDLSTIADMLLALAWQAFHREDYGRVEMMAGEGLALHKSLGNGGRAAEALWLLAIVAQQRGLFDRANVLHAESLSLRRARGDDHGVAQSLSALAQIALQQRKVSEARNLLTDALEMLREGDARWSRAMTITLLGHVELAAGDIERAEAHLAEGLRTFTAIGNQLYVPWSVDGMAGVAAVRGEPERAALLLGAGEALRQRLNSSLRPVDPARYADTAAAARAALRDATFAALQDEGRALTVKQAIAAALEGTLPEPVGPEGTF